jgi:omega-6 fatty acid desaturase (delta-12 desaturase)
MTAADTEMPIGGRERPFWRDAIGPYERSRPLRAMVDLATSIVPYFLLCGLMYLALDVSVWLTLALAVPAGGFLLRTFIIFHDCAHGSFLSSRRANLWVGRLCAFVTYQAFANWKHSHAIHHGSAGDLDRRGTGDVPTYTVEEYEAMSWRGRLGYRLFRNPLVMFGIGPIWALMIGPRIWSRSMRRKQRNSVLITNLGLALVIGGLIYAIGLEAWLLVQMPAAFLAAVAGVWLFYVQHQFEDVYWESGERWSYADAALRGSSYLRLPKVFQFFTGNIGLHHVHHLSAKVPNYNLQRAHDENEIFADVPVLTASDGLRSIRLKLIDPDAGCLITWTQLRARRAGVASATPAAS